MTELSFGLCRDAAYYGTVEDEKANDNGQKARLGWVAPG
jgi:hypothetical protein